MCDELKKQGVTKGSIAITENNHNATEDMVAKVFADGIKKYCPEFTVLPVELEGPEPTQAIAVATSIIQANPDLVAALSTTGGGPTTWAGAQKETGKKIVAVGMDTTRVNLDLVTNGEVWGLVAQPLFEETFGSAELLYKMANGEKVPYWTVLEAPLVTKDNTQALLRPPGPGRTQVPQGRRTRMRPPRKGRRGEGQVLLGAELGLASRAPVHPAGLPRRL